MILGRNQQEYQSWKNQVWAYEKNKRTKKPFGKEFVPVTERVSDYQVRQKQRQFNPVLQKYQDSSKQIKLQEDLQKNRNASLTSNLKMAGKNYRPYDIITLYGQVPELKSKSVTNFQRKDKQVVRNIYNPINNKPIPAYYLNSKNVNPTPDRKFKYQGPKIRQFDIVKCQYREDNEQKMQRDFSLQNQKIYEKYEKTHAGYDPVRGNFYNPEKQHQFKEDLAKSQMLQSSGVNYNKRFPPTYLSREPLILDRTKPPTDALLAIDQKNSRAKQHFKLKYIIQEEYKKRNLQDFDKKEALIRNRVHNSHSFENMAKQFRMEDRQSSGYRGRQYQKIQSNRDLYNSMNFDSRSNSSRMGSSMSIKSGGFS